MSGYDLRLLGPPSLKCEGRETEFGLRKAQALAIYLAVTRQRHSRDWLATLFWPTDSQRNARSNLRRALYRVQSAVNDDFLLVTKEAMGLDPHCQVTIDSETFGEIAAECRRDKGYVDYLDETWRSRLSLAADLYKADFLAGFTLPDCPEFDEWQFFQRDGLRRGLLDVLEQLVHIWEQLGELEQALGYAHRWLEADPLHEPAHRKVMELNALLGRRTVALRQFEELRRKLEVELGVTPDHATLALWEVIRTNRRSPAPDPEPAAPLPAPIVLLPCRHATALPPADSPLRPANNLPAPAAPLIGREADLAAICGLLTGEPTCRLLTLVGAGGMGKSRLAIAAAHSVARLFRDGICFMSLAESSAPAAWVDVVAGALRLQLPPQANATSCLQHLLRNKQLLLVLDNVERVNGIVEILPELLQAAPGIVVLAASTERLHLREEWVYDLRGLALPPPPDATAQHDHPDYTSFGAVQLFLQNARRTNTNFVVTPESLNWVVKICRLVDGIPLALELASSLTRHMSLAEIAQGIEDGLDLLETSLRNVPARHRSMATVFADMWRRLDESERRVLCSLTIFPGSCTRAAIEAVTGASTALVNSLVDKSLVYYSGGGRIAMHRLLRRYVMGRMQTAPGELAEARDRHCRYYAALLHQHVQESTRANRREVQLPLEEEMDNLRAALRHARTSHELRAIAEEIEKYCIIPVYES